MSQTRHATSKALILTIVLILVAPSFAQVAYAKQNTTKLSGKGLITQDQVCKGVVRYTEYVPIKIEGFPKFAFYTVNVYAVDTGKGVVLVDSGTEDLAQRLYIRVKTTFGRTPIIAVLLTHGHADHAGGGGFFQDKGAVVFVGSGDLWMVETGNDMVPYDDFRYTGYTPDATYEASSLPAGFKYYSVPGHTEGSVVLEYTCKKLLFTGDASLPYQNEDINKLDFTSIIVYTELTMFTQGELETQLNSLNSILPLISDKTIMCPGHKGIYKGPQAAANIYVAIGTIQNILNS
jgi:glyoxylase-like metal-dependent hydrolase (beta-lactamase superfamily II)